MSNPRCGCGRLVHFDGRFGTWRRFCGRSCAGKALAQWSAAHVSHAQRVQRGREGAAVRQASYQVRLLEVTKELPRDVAILRAYQMGRHALKVARLDGRA